MHRKILLMQQRIIAHDLLPILNILIKIFQERI